MGSPSFRAELSEQLSFAGAKDSSVSVNPRYYETPALKNLTQQLTHQACFGDGISLVQGEPKSGKSTAAFQLEKALNNTAQLHLLSLHGDTQAPELIKLLVQGFVLDVEQSSTGEQIAALRNFCQLLEQEQRLAALLIDNAHHISEQALGILLSLLQGQAEGGVGLHIAFFAEPGLDVLMDKLQVLDVAVYDFDIPHLMQAEVPGFLRSSNFDLLSRDDDMLLAAWEISEGLVGSVLAFAEANVKSSEKSTGGVEEKGKPVAPLPILHLSLIGLLLLVLLFGAWFKHQNTTTSSDLEADSDPVISLYTQDVNVLSKPPDEIELADTGSGESLKKHGDDVKKTISFESSTTNDSVESDYINLPDRRFDSKPINLTGLGQELLDEQSPLAEGAFVSLDIRSMGSPLPQLSVPSIDAALLSGGAREESEDDAETLGSPVADTLSSVSASAASGKGRSAERLAQGAGKRSAIVKTAKVKTAKVKTTKDESFLLAQGSGKYTLQVIAASKQELLREYIARQPNRSALYLFRGEREGKRWYVVVEGVYNSRELALQAIRRLPPEQSKGGPWPRKLKVIQEEIRKIR
ncbi:MAG: hypothetical protein COA42_03945 [Alteromonadaceae bacterium]|nr:MAG: hypothetical protein COA42_03945 [Alteromonadaceae bacterium]